MNLPRRIVTGHDASGKSVVLSDAPTPKTLDIGTAAFHEIWLTAETPVPIAATEPEPTDRPVRTPPPSDGGSETRVGVGDAVVQRGTNHAWANRSDRPVRMLFVMIDGAITDELRATVAPLEFFDQVLE
jgi:hypothetical protein